MNIGFDAKRIVRNGSGLGNYGRTLVNDLAEIVDPDTMLYLYAPDEGNEHLRKQVSDSNRIQFVYPSKTWFKSLWRSRGIVKDLHRDHIDIYHGLSGELPIGIRQSGIRSVVTIHDLIFMRHPEYYHWWDAKIYAAKFQKTVKEADRIIAISECTKRDIVELGGVNPDRIDVIYQSCGATFRYPANDDKKQEVNARYLLPPRYIINVGTIEERKNILLAVKAMEQLQEDLSLVIVGRSTPYAQQVKRYVEEHHLGDRVHFLHDVTNADLPAIYQMAEVCVYPSRYEGFGIPVIEAIQSGLPVVACTGSCLEEAGGPDCLYVNPDDVQGMAESIRQLLQGAEGREQRILQAQDYIRRFEGNNVAEQVLKVYKSLIR
jgi:glycosyltransferase involved in cell wall biosynthesis